MADTRLPQVAKMRDKLKPQAVRRIARGFRRITRDAGIAADTMAVAESSATAPASRAAGTPFERSA